MTRNDDRPVHELCTQHTGLLGRLNLIIALMLGTATLIFYNTVNTGNAINRMSEQVHANRASIQALENSDKAIQQQIGRIDREIEKRREAGR